jgi:hypothetical protein
MDNKTILNFKINDTDKLSMILSNNIDKACSDGGLISVNAFDKLIADLIEWKNSDQCNHFFYINHESSVVRCFKCGLMYPFEKRRL